MRLISTFLARAVDLYPEQIAVIDGERRLTFCQLDLRVRRLVGALRGLGLRRGDRVAVLDVNSSRYLELYYACAQAGFVLAPLNIRLSPPEIRYILRDCGARALVVSPLFFDLAREAVAQEVSLEHVIALDEAFSESSHDYETILTNAAPDEEKLDQSPEDVCNIYYTSGTTGEPKGVCLTLGNMTASAWDSILSLGLGSDDVWLHAAPMFHLVDAWAVWSFPLMGATQVAVHFDPVSFMQAVATSGATGTGLPPTLINMIASHPRLGEYDLSSLRFIMYGGAPTPISLLERASSVLSARFVHAYGITETSGITTVLPPKFFCATGDAQATRLTHSAGYPVANLRLEVAGSDGRFLPAGEVGEVVVSGARVMKEYWNKPKHTADVLKDGWYHTGDMGFLDAEHRLFVVDRKKDMIITGGENVYSVEVENVIASHPAVMEVAVIGVPHDSWGEAVKAIIALKPGVQTNERDLLDFCRGRIAGYKIPKSFDLQSDPLPKIGPGKIAKRRLRDPFWAGRENTDLGGDMREIMRDGLSCLEGGREDAGPLLLLLHGLGATKEVWAPVMELLEARWPGAWIAPDFPGHGASSPCAHDSYGAYAAAIASLVPEDRKVIVMGHSLGGVVGMLLGSGLFGFQVSSVHALSVKVRWTAEEIARICEFSRTPAKYFDSKEEAVARYLRVSGLHGLVGETDPSAQAGVIAEGGRHRLAALPATNGVAGGDGDMVRSICKTPVFYATGGADPIAPAEAFDALGMPVHVLPALAHNAHVQDPAAVCAWFLSTCQVTEAMS